MTVAWLVVRWGDCSSAASSPLAFARRASSAAMFWIENALFVGAALVFVTPAGRASQRASFLGRRRVAARRRFYRLDAYLIGYTPVGNWTYFPSVPEMMVTVGVISLEVLLYLVFIKTLPVLHGEAAHPT